MMIAAAHTLREAHRANELAGSSTVSPDWTPVATRIRDEATDNWDDTVAVKRLEDAGARFVRGRGVLAGDGRVEVAGTTYTATGGWWSTPGPHRPRRRSRVWRTRRSGPTATP
jgi:pyruvate/2-oxoglutarate dehydrogenase complex dihydrolipoamide dehydrogenase (E3) component